jgi:hypothetical protein
MTTHCREYYVRTIDYKLLYIMPWSFEKVTLQQGAIKQILNLPIEVPLQVARVPDYVGRGDDRGHRGLGGDARVGAMACGSGACKIGSGVRASVNRLSFWPHSSHGITRRRPRARIECYTCTHGRRAR